MSIPKGVDPQVCGFATSMLRTYMAAPELHAFRASQRTQRTLRSPDVLDLREAFLDHSAIGGRVPEGTYDLLYTLAYAADWESVAPALRAAVEADAAAGAA